MMPEGLNSMTGIDRSNASNEAADFSFFRKKICLSV